MTSAASSARAAFASARRSRRTTSSASSIAAATPPSPPIPGRRLDNNYSLNTVDICPVGALTSTDFRFKMRVWFLKETKSFCTSCATGCNTVIGARENVIYRQTPRENDAVNSVWMCDYGRLNFDYLQSERAPAQTRRCARQNKLEPVRLEAARSSTPPRS